jgi:hypothetical protein
MACGTSPSSPELCTSDARGDRSSHPRTAAPARWLGTPHLVAPLACEHVEAQIL